MSTNNTLNQYKLSVATTKRGVFEAGADGKITLNYLYDSDIFRGEIAVFSLEGMDVSNLPSELFVQEAAKRSLSGTQGYILLSNRSETSSNSTTASQPDLALNTYMGIKSFTFEPGTQFALLFIHNATAETLANHPELASRDTAVQAIFSIPEANFKGKDSHKIIELQGMAAIGAGNYALAYLTIESHSGKDYDDVTFQITETR